MAFQHTNYITSLWFSVGFYSNDEISINVGRDLGLKKEISKERHHKLFLWHHTILHKVKDFSNKCLVAAIEMKRFSFSQINTK